MSGGSAGWETWLGFGVCELFHGTVDVLYLFSLVLSLCI